MSYWWLAAFGTGWANVGCFWDWMSYFWLLLGLGELLLAAFRAIKL